MTASSELSFGKSCPSGSDIEAQAQFVLLVRTCLNTLAQKLCYRYEQTGHLKDLKNAIKMAKLAVEAIPQGHPDHAERLDQLGILLESWFDQSGNIEDLEQAIQLQEQAVRTTPASDPNRAIRLYHLGNMLESLYECRCNSKDLDEAIRVAKLAAQLLPQYVPEQALCLNNLGNMLECRYEQTGRTEDLEEAIQMGKQAVRSIPEDHVDRAACLNNLGKKLERRYEQTKYKEDLEMSIQMAEQAVRLIPSHHPDRATFLSNLACKLGSRFELTGEVRDVREATLLVQLARSLCLDNHPHWAVYLNNLWYELGRRYERTDCLDYLNRAIEVAELAVESTPGDHPDRARYLNHLGNELGRRYERTDCLDDLNRAIEVAELVVGSTPGDHPDRAEYLNHLGNELGRRYERTGCLDDLNRAIEVAELVMESTPGDHPDRAAYLNNLGAWLGRRFERAGMMDDLKSAVDIVERAVEAIPMDYNRASLLHTLGALLGRRFERTGSLDYLDRAIEVAEIAVGDTPVDHNRAGLLNTLGTLLGRRFGWTGAIDDLNRAIEVTDMAIKATPPDHPIQAGWLSNLGGWLGIRFKRTTAIEDLNRAVEVATTAVEATPRDHPDRANRLNNLANQLSRRFKQTGETDDLNRGIEVAEFAVGTTPVDHPNQAGLLNTLGTLLGRRFGWTGAIDDLNRAIEVTNMAIIATPPDHPIQAGWLNNLGGWLGRRFERTGMMDDLKSSLFSFKTGWNCHNASPFVRIRLAQRAARMLAFQSNWEESSMLLQDAVKLLPLLCPQSLQHTDKQHMLAGFPGLASMAAATALNAGKDAYHAIELLELGRGIIAGLLLEMRADISDLQQEHPNLAEAFISLRQELDSPPDSATFPTLNGNAPLRESLAKRRREAEKNLSDLLKLIRTQPGFRNFLLPPTADELMAAANPDPIIIVNVSSYRCDAFLIERHQIRVLELPDLRLEDVEKRVQCLRSTYSKPPVPMIPILEWLWDVVARPTLEALGFQRPVSDNKWPHVWWIPIGPLSHLPLHAAGRHGKGSTETVLDRVMSSYSSSVKALLYGRQKRIRKSAGASYDRAVLVGMRDTPGTITVLPFAGDEVSMLGGLCPSLQLIPIEPTQQKGDVLKHLSACTIFHFAGHGRSDPVDPSRSCLLLDDWQDNPLTVADLRECKLGASPPFLAFLSACSTAANQADRLVDEGIHLVSALQLAGFRHAIGTLWEVSDSHCVDVARLVYETIQREGMTDMAICRGLHQAIRALRDRCIETTRGGGRHKGKAAAGNETDMMQLARGAELHDYESGQTTLESPFYWAPYIHFGV